jgi:toxin ParE1/3/4
VELNWTEFAIADLDQIEMYISSEGSSAAAVERMIKVIDVAEKVLLKHSSAGRAGRVKGTRELIIAGTPFIIVYRLVAKLDQVQLLRIYCTVLGSGQRGTK